MSESEAKYEAMIEAMAGAIAKADMEDFDLAPTPDALYALFARAAAEAIGLKPGMVVVPADPTDLMTGEGSLAADLEEFDYEWTDQDELMRKAYRAMIAARPQPTSAG
jgi:hypothetical protein